MAQTTLNANPSQQFSPLFFDVDRLIARIEEALKRGVKQPIQPNAIYSYEELVEVTGFSLSTIIRADRSGRLKGRYEGRRRYFVGSEILKWLGDKEGGDD
ncbi:MAG: helix-turn-helix domain-containing protein [Acidobacteriota bacterium]|nr:helix-turn-helix domain-containing protein [Acidobacteriota bacterium]